MIRFIAKKAAYEIRCLQAVLKYPVMKKEILGRLAVNMTGINVETTNICNANCIFCAYQYQQRPTGVMTMDLYKKVLSDFLECGGGNLSFTPTVGDPLVDPLLLERIRLARKHTEIATIGTYSNLILLRKFNAHELINSGVNEIVISTSGLDEEMYKRIYRSTRYRKVLSNIKELIMANNNSGNPVKITVDMRVDRPIEEIRVMPDYKDVASLVGEGNMSIKFRYDNWGGKITQDQLTGNMRLRNYPSTRNIRISPCKELYNGPTIYWDGKVGACSCRDVDAKELIIGDITRQHLAAIWHGDEIRRLRDEFLTSKVKDICKQCSHYSNLSLYCLPEYRKNELDKIRPLPDNLMVYK